MRSALDELLCKRYPALFVNRYGDMQETCMCWGFEVGDGWFGILDAASDVLTRQARVDGRPVSTASQVKEKYGTLRFYLNGFHPFDEGVVDMAEDMSERVSEMTGRAGRLGVRHHWFATRAPGEEDYEYCPPELDESDRMGVPALGFTAAQMTEWRADVFRGPMSVPVGWLDIVDAMLLRLSRRGEAGFVHGVRRGPDGALTVEYGGGDEYVAGVVAMAVAMAARTNPDNGSAGPVHDGGKLEA